ncbi:hypothetical protein SLS62_003406 [Diatrype stigma]|uniref:MARVEL domain-containing protein n=1 Tax=Diatrype stigma TaxID=117547 RepID=A0AAN9YPZ0_9PEZI
MGLFGMAISYISFSILHFFQFVLAVTVCGLYAVDLDSAHKQGKYTDGKWVYAVVVGALSAVTSLLYLIPFILRFAAVTAWSAVLFVLWIALFGIFGRMYIHEDPEDNAGIRRMKSAVWVDLASALLWLIGTLASAAYWWTHRERHSRFTGRARLDRNASVRSRSSAWRA